MKLAHNFENSFNRHYQPRSADARKSHFPVGSQIVHNYTSLANENQSLDKNADTALRKCFIGIIYDSNQFTPQWNGFCKRIIIPLN
jgi:hypothetical protein